MTAHTKLWTEKQHYKIFLFLRFIKEHQLQTLVSTMESLFLPEVRECLVDLESDPDPKSPIMLFYTPYISSECYMLRIPL